MRLIDADKLILFPNNPESGTKVMIDNWIDECGLSNLELYITEDCPVDIEHALTELCWKVIQGYINVIETESTAFDVDKVVEQLEKQVYEIDDSLSLSARDVIDEEDVFEIVKAGGV